MQRWFHLNRPLVQALAAGCGATRVVVVTCSIHTSTVALQMAVGMGCSRKDAPPPPEEEISAVWWGRMWGECTSDNSKMY